VNSRDLRTLQVDPSVFERAAGSWPADVTAVAESGIATAPEAIRLSRLGTTRF
jgi:indole-3-glycerol phosphate synthase